MAWMIFQPVLVEIQVKNVRETGCQNGLRALRTFLPFNRMPRNKYSKIGHFETGVSAESGIPNFRGVNGLWRNHRIEEVASPHALARGLRLVWEFYSMRRRVASLAKPNPAHFALAKLEQTLGDRLFLCTQNVDNLHEQARSMNVLHMHGELFKSRCDSRSRLPFDNTNTYEPPAELPRCECGGGIRPQICWFGETPFALDRIFQALDQCTIFMAIGTSGVVEPAASFVAHVRGHARTIYVGPEEPASRRAVP
jgi:NAD-dependent deacetylase